MDTRRIVGTTCLGNPIYETDPNLPPLTKEEEIRHAMDAGIFDCVEVGSDGKALEESEGVELSPCSCVNGCLIRKDKTGQASCPLADRRYVMADDDLAVTPPHDNDLEFGKIVQEERKRLGLSMYRLAQLSGVCSTTIRNIEAGIRITERTKAFVRFALNDCAQGRLACNG